jgi:hypothetical protein
MLIVIGTIVMVMLFTLTGIVFMRALEDKEK